MNADRLPKCRPGRLFGPAVLLVVGLSGPAQANPFSPDGGGSGVDEAEINAIIDERLEDLEREIANISDHVFYDDPTDPRMDALRDELRDELQFMIDELLMEAQDEAAHGSPGATPEAPAVTGEPLGRINGQHYIRHATSGRAVAVSAEEYAQAMAYQSAMRTAAEQAAQMDDEAASLDEDSETGGEDGGADESRSQSADRTTPSPAEFIE